MSHTIENRHERIADAATDKADDLSLQLNRLTDLVKLAAFAVEARRVLSDLHEAKSRQPELEKAIMKAVPASNSWLAMDDNVGEILGHVAIQLEKVNDGFTEGMYSLAGLKKGGAQ